MKTISTQRLEVEGAKECPFCGELPVADAVTFDDGTTHVHLVCERSDCQVNVFVIGNTLDEAIEKWNRRAD